MKFIPFVLVMETIMGAILFGAAGRTDLPWFWAILGIHATLMTATMLTMDPGLRHERLRPGPGGQCRHVRFVAMPFILAHLVVAGLDAGRFGWSGLIPTGVRAIALAA